MALGNFEMWKSPGNPGSPEVLLSAEEYLQQALKTLSTLEDRETFGDYFHGERNKISEALEKATQAAQTPAEIQRVNLIKNEVGRRIGLLYTWGLGIIPAAMSGNRDLGKFNVEQMPQKDIINSSTIGGLIKEPSTLNPEAAIQNLTTAKGGRSETVELGTLTFRRTPIGEVMRYFDGVMRGSIKVDLPGTNDSVSNDNIQANLDSLLAAAQQKLEPFGVPPQAVTLGFRLWWAVTFHPSYWMEKPEDMGKITSPTLSDWFFKLFRADQYQTKYINRSTDAFLPDFVRLMFGVKGKGTRLDAKVVEEVSRAMRRFGYDRPDPRQHHTTGHEFSDYQWLFTEPVVQKGVAHTQAKMEGIPPRTITTPQGTNLNRQYTPVDYGWSFMPPLAFFRTKIRQNDVNFYAYEDKNDGGLIYEAMPWETLPSNVYGDYIVKMQNGPLKFAKDMMYANALDVTGKMTHEVTYADWKNTIYYTVPATRKLSQENSEAAQHKMRLVFFISGVIYRTIRSEIENRWDDRKVKQAVEAAVSADFITHRDGQMVMDCWVPIIKLLLERIGHTLEQGLKYGGGGKG